MPIFLLSLILFFFSLILVSCGLPTYAYLSAPTLIATRSNPENNYSDLIFKNAYENDSTIFSGYELYYKIYDPINDDSDEYIDDRNEFDDDIGTTKLISLGFSRLNTADTFEIDTYTHSEIKPAISLGSDLINENFNIRMKFIQEYPLDESFYAYIYDSDDTLSFSNSNYLYRRIENKEDSSEESNKFFDIDDFDIKDSDLPDTVDLNNEYLYISFYVLSFGRETDDISQYVYSEPLYLGTLKFYCELTDD